MRSGHTCEGAPNHACSSPDTSHTATSWNARTGAMKPHSQPYLTYLCSFIWYHNAGFIFLWSTICTILAFCAALSTFSLC